MEVNKIILEYLKVVDSSVVSEGISDNINITRLADVKQVRKPWGFELWLSDASETPYALKVIYLKKGTKTSLQYHKKKTEHNFVLSGKTVLHYEDQAAKMIRQVEVKAGTVIQIKPPAIHRLEALTDLVLVEASSAQLDDVVRLADDYKRPDGKILAEHEEKQTV